MFTTVLALAASVSLHVSLGVSHAAAPPTCVGRSLSASFLTARLRTPNTQRNDALPSHSSGVRVSRRPLLSRPSPCLHPTKPSTRRCYKAADDDSLGELTTAAPAPATRWLRRRRADTRPRGAARFADTEADRLRLCRRAGGKAGRVSAAVKGFPTNRTAAGTETACHRLIELRTELTTQPGQISKVQMHGKPMDPVRTTTERPLIGTHSGTFHADEVLATVMLLSLPEYKDAKLLRSRDPAALATCDIVVDVGSEYCPAALRFDHHQRSFVTTFYDEGKHKETAGPRGGGGQGDGALHGALKCEGRGEKLPHPNANGNGFTTEGKRKYEQCTGETGQDKSATSIGEQQGRGWPSEGKPITKLSSAGLIYKHFGRRLLTHRYGITDVDTLNMVYQRLYRTFVEAIDAIDNGVSVVPGGGPVAYKDSTNLSSRIARCNPPWNFESLRQKFPDYPRYHPEKEPLYPVEIDGGDVEGNIGFRRAMLLAADALDGAARGLIDIWLPARDIVATAIKGRYTVHPSGQIIKLERWCPFEEHLFLLEREMNVDPPLYFCLYPEVKEGEVVGWRIRAVGVEDHMLESRLPLSPRFRGLRDTELGSAVCSAVEGDSEKSNIKPEDFIHCHATGFIAGATTLDAALALGGFTLKEAALTVSSTV